MAVRLLHLTGSAVSAFHCDLSRLYARGCLRVIADAPQYESHLAYVTPDGRWRFPADLGDAAIAAAEPVSCAEALARITALEVDVMVPQMFCLAGMTHYRALFDVLRIPYVGNAPDVMALTSHKARTRAVVAGAGVDVPPGEVVRAGQRPALAPPVVVKPVDADNSAGLTLVRDRAGYAGALEAALAESDAALVERYVPLGREVRCGLLVEDGRLVRLPLEEYAMDSATKPIRGAEDKLRRSGDGELELVAKERTRAWIVPIEDPVTERVWELAERCHVALGCRHYSLFDVRIDPDGRPWFMEAGLYCSFSEQSVITVMARAAGIEAPALFALALANVLSTSEVKR